MGFERIIANPTEWLCPYCGHWHKWKGGSISRKFISVETCPNLEKYNYNSQDTGEVGFYFDSDDDLVVELKPICNYTNYGGKTYFYKNILIDLFRENRNKETFSYYSDEEFEPQEYDGQFDETDDDFPCNYCDFQEKCNYYHYMSNNQRPNFVKTKVGLRWENPVVKMENSLKGKYDNLKSVSNQLVAPDGVSTSSDNNKSIKMKKREEKDMGKNNNLFNFDGEYGLNNDTNISSTLLGIAVNNGKSWKIYDKDKKTIVDIGDIEMESLPIYVIPSTKVAVGDLLKDENGDYEFVTSISNNRIETTVVKSGEIKVAVPIKNILGFSCYTKIVAFNDMLGFDGVDFDTEKFLMMSAMSGSNSSMLPMIMMMNDDGEKDIDKMLLYMVLSSANTKYVEDDEDSNPNANAMNMLMPLMLLNRKGNEGNEDMKKMMMLMSMSGNNGNMNNMLPFLMMDHLFAKKETVVPISKDGSDDSSSSNNYSI